MASHHFSPPFEEYVWNFFPTTEQANLRPRSTDVLAAGFNDFLSSPRSLGFHERTTAHMFQLGGRVNHQLFLQFDVSIGLFPNTFQ